jgi:N-methylhydantoinase A
MPPDYAIAVDVGGTFTDVTLARHSTGQLWQLKTPTTGDDQSVAFAEGVRRVLAQAAVRPVDVGAVYHGTTVATNAVLERKGARIGLVTTRGFRYVLHIGRHDVPKHAHTYSWRKPERLVPPRRVVEVNERIQSDGMVVTPLDEDQCRSALRALAAQRIESLAISLLHSYANPAHEQRVRELALEELGVPCSLSSDVLPVFREYERTSAAVLNAYLMPAVARYHQRISHRLRDLGIDAPLRIMKSNGGMYGAEGAARLPIHATLSGPAAAVVGSLVVAQATGEPDIISIDVGGTSADVCLSRNGAPAISMAGEIAELPLNIPMLDVHTIGAGGGSIALVGTDGTLKVGPESAGASPGPACYGRGGTAPTVTDANLVLGRLGTTIGAGALSLEPALAEAAVQRAVATPLGLPVRDAASGIVDLINNRMVDAIRAVSVERGYDPRDFTLIAGGGAGGLHAAALAQLLGIRRVIVPASAGLLSTLGLLGTDLRNDCIRTCIRDAQRVNDAELAALFEEPERAVNTWLQDEGVRNGDARVARSAGLRYAKQAYEISVPMTQGGDAAALIAAFHAEHQRQYGWSSTSLPVELVNVGVTAWGLLQKVDLQKAGPGRRNRPQPIAWRAVYFGRRIGELRTPVFDYADLSPGWQGDGPAIVEHPFTTVLVLPGCLAAVDAHGSLVMEVRG